MSSLQVKSNIAQVNAVLQSQLKAMTDPEKLLRPLCFDLIDLITKRIHIDGVASDGQQIGQYSSPYLKLRQKKYNRTADRKVIVSLTRQLESNWTVIATPRGYGIGFLNKFNYDKMRWVEEQRRREIASLSDAERDYSIAFINNYVGNVITGNAQ